TVAVAIEKAQFTRAIEAVLDLGHFANKYFNDQQPWESVKKDQQAAQNTIFNTLQLVSALRVLLKPFTPFSSEKLSLILNYEKEYDPTAEVAKKGRVSQYIDQWEFKP